jgi:hypothetical protein
LKGKTPFITVGSHNYEHNGTDENRDGLAMAEEDGVRRHELYSFASCGTHDLECHHAGTGFVSQRNNGVGGFIVVVDKG